MYCFLKSTFAQFQYVMKSNRKVQNLNQSINLRKQILVAITFEIATVILKDVAVNKSDKKNQSTTGA